MREISDNESIRVRLDAQTKRWLYQEKERTGKSASQIIREALQKTRRSGERAYRKNFKK